jgi:hypothetical protein
MKIFKTQILNLTRTLIKILKKINLKVTNKKNNLNIIIFNNILRINKIIIQLLNLI